MAVLGKKPKRDKNKYSKHGQDHEHHCELYCEHGMRWNKPCLQCKDASVKAAGQELPPNQRDIPE